jgi:hypothetical protein
MGRLLIRIHAGGYVSMFFAFEVHFEVLLLQLLLLASREMFKAINCEVE